MSRPDEVLIGVQLGDTVHAVYGKGETGFDAAWRILDSSCKALEKAGKDVPRDVVSAMGLLRPWVQEPS